MPPANTGNFSNHLAPGIRAIIGTNLKGSEVFYSKYYDIETSERNFEDYLAAAGLPIAPQKEQGVAITAIDPLEGITKRVTPETWGIGFEVTREAWEDDLYASSGSALRDASNGIADSLRERVEIEAHRPLNSEGFSGTNFTVLPNDTDTLFATAHAPVTGGEAASQSNRTDADLSVTTYRTALIRFMNIVNDRGLRIPGYTTPRTLIVSPTLKYTAMEIVQSTNRPDTANRVENVSQNETSVSVTPYMTDTDMWIIQGSKHFMKLLWRWRPRMDNFDDRRKQVATFVGFQRFKVQPVHWLGMDGSLGV
ncbi:MAG: hypothetical protein V3S43_06305 [Acidimicrobiia bacterium]